MKRSVFSLFMVADSFGRRVSEKIPSTLVLYNSIHRLFKGSSIYDRYVTELFKKLIRPGMTVVDIGAGVGYYTLLVAKLVGNRGKVYAFEPEPTNYHLLTKNIEINNYTNILPVQKAVSNRCGSSKLFVDKFNLGAHSFSENNISTQKKEFVKVETVTLDKFFGNNMAKEKVDFIKTDVEGAEGLVMEGARKILRKSNHLKIIMEFWLCGLKNTGTDPLKLLCKLQNYGFKIKLIDERNQCIKQIDRTELAAFCEHVKNVKGFDSRPVNLLLEKALS